MKKSKSAKPAAKKKKKAKSPRRRGAAVNFEVPAPDQEALVQSPPPHASQAAVAAAAYCNGVVCAEGTVSELRGVLDMVKAKKYGVNDNPPASPPNDATSGTVYGGRLWRFYCHENKGIPGHGDVNPAANNNQLVVWAHIAGDPADQWASNSVRFKGKLDIKCDCQG